MTETQEVSRFSDTPVERQEYGVARSNALGGEIARTGELAVAQVEAQARALVQARFFMADRRKRTWDDVEQRLIRECQRPRFAASAWYIKPVGGDRDKWPRGLTIRFAEAALRVAGNIDVQTQTVYDDEWKRVVRVSVMDLETNFGYTKEVAVDKTVERTVVDKTREVLSVRQNSAGKNTYLVKATDDEVTVKQNAVVSKEIRTQGLRLIPADILDECKAVIQDTIAKGANAEDPEAARKSVLDNFATIGVMPADLAKYLEHDTATLQPAEVVTLRGIFTAIKAGEATWKDVLEAKFGAADDESEAAKKLRERLKKPPAPAAKPANDSAAAKPAANPPAADAPAGSGPAAANQPPVVPTFATWEACGEAHGGDTLAKHLGLEVEIKGKRYVRGSIADTWAPKK